MSHNVEIFVSWLALLYHISEKFEKWNTILTHSVEDFVATKIYISVSRCCKVCDFKYNFVSLCQKLWESILQVCLIVLNILRNVVQFRPRRSKFLWGELRFVCQFPNLWGVNYHFVSERRNICMLNYTFISQCRKIWEVMYNLISHCRNLFERNYNFVSQCRKVWQV